MLKTGQLKQLKIDNDYHQRSLAETAMGRYKQLNSLMLSLRDGDEQSHCLGSPFVSKLLNRLETLE